MAVLVCIGLSYLLRCTLTPHPQLPPSLPSNIQCKHNVIAQPATTIITCATLKQSQCDFRSLYFQGFIFLLARGFTKSFYFNSSVLFIFYKQKYFDLWPELFHKQMISSGRSTGPSGWKGQQHTRMLKSQWNGQWNISPDWQTQQYVHFFSCFLF